jgi:hypothetical protein
VRLGGGGGGARGRPHRAAVAGRRARGREKRVRDGGVGGRR